MFMFESVQWMRHASISSSQGFERLQLGPLQLPKRRQKKLFAASRVGS
jgi:hypothetical protein